MILLKKHRLIFLKPKKVAGTSFEIALSYYAAKNDIITEISEEHERKLLGCRGPQNFTSSFLEAFKNDKKEFLKAIYNKRRPRKYYNHISAKEAKKKIIQSEWEDFDKISIVRNPFDVIVSMYFWHNRGATSLDKNNFLRWVKNNPHVLCLNKDFYTIDGLPVINYLLRYEALREDILNLELEKPQLKGLAETFEMLKTKQGVRPKDASATKFFAGEQKLIDSVYFFNQDIIDKFRYDIM